MPVESDAELREILGLKRVASVGCSSTPGKDAHEVPKYLEEHGYHVIPVNPNVDEILGHTAYDSLAAVDEEIDIVQVFRPSDEVPGIVDEALARDDVKAIWLQLGIYDGDSIARAEADGRCFVQDHCMRIEHQRLLG